MVRHRRTLATAFLALALPAAAPAAPEPDQQPNQDSNESPAARPDPAPDSLHILVFTRTAGFRHASIPDGIACFRELAAEHGFALHATEDPAEFTPERLARFDAAVFLNTTGDVLDEPQQAAFEAWYRSGKGFLGVHSAADTEYDWPWYGRLVGAYFKSHPAVQPARIIIHTRAHPATAHLGTPPEFDSWRRTDEWYDFRAPPDGSIPRLLSLDTTTYEGGAMGPDHPIAWFHEFDGGRAIYTAGGHTPESYREPEFRLHLLGALRWAAGRAD